jgi:fructose-1,6-bisphosphatase/sedoheptulose 1,7-bisphosphatase-like protein
VQRCALGLLFAVLALVFAATGIAALVGAGGGAKGWVVAVGARALGAWLGSLAVSAFRAS